MDSVVIRIHGHPLTTRGEPELGRLGVVVTADRAVEGAICLDKLVIGLVCGASNGVVPACSSSEECKSMRGI